MDEYEDTDNLPENEKDQYFQLISSALQVQLACNLSGVVHSFSRDISKLRELFPQKGTDWYNHHPICVLYSSKIGSLTGSESTRFFREAYDWCVIRKP